MRHVLSLSGGKDSTALAVYMRDRIPEMEYVFCDTQKELVETYEYLSRIEGFLGKPVVRLSSAEDGGRGFDHHLELFRGYLPSPQMRWCTRKLKIEPFEQYIGDEPVMLYIGIRADENREGYISTKSNITPVYPFKTDGITKPDVFRILEDSGIGVPEYYKWRTRSGCYFCFYQQKIEWVRLKETYPDLYDKAKEYERPYEKTGNFFTWSQGESLAELERPERMGEIKREHVIRIERKALRRENVTLMEVFAQADSAEAPEDDDDQGCLVCQL